MPFAVTWMDPEIVILSEVSQTENEKATYGMGFLKRKEIGTEGET